MYKYSSQNCIWYKLGTNRGRRDGHIKTNPPLKDKLPPEGKEILPATPPGDLAYCASNLERFFSNPFCVISPAKTDIQKLHDQSGLTVILDDNNVFTSHNTEISMTSQLHENLHTLEHAAVGIVYQLQSSL